MNTRGKSRLGEERKYEKIKSLIRLSKASRFVTCKHSCRHVIFLRFFFSPFLYFIYCYSTSSLLSSLIVIVDIFFFFISLIFALCKRQKHANIFRLNNSLVRPFDILFFVSSFLQPTKYRMHSIFWITFVRSDFAWRWYRLFSCLFCVIFRYYFANAETIVYKIDGISSRTFQIFFCFHYLFQ